MARRLPWLLALLCALSSISCEKALKEMKQKEQARRQERESSQRSTLEQTYAALQFLADGMAGPPELETKPCDDGPLRDKYRPTARLCTRLPTIDYAFLRHLLGADALPEPERKRWAWMRRGGVELLERVDALDEGLDLKRASDAAEKIRTGHLGVFTPLPASAGAEPARYQGFLVIYDVQARQPTCQVGLDVEVGKIFNPPVRRRGHSELPESPRRFQSSFWREVNRELRTITKVFCTKYPS